MKTCSFHIRCSKLRDLEETITSHAVFFLSDADQLGWKRNNTNVAMEEKVVMDDEINCALLLSLWY
jgi:hypothetical protein